MTTQPRLIALNRSIARRLKLDEQMRLQLATQRAEQTAIEEQCSDQRACVEAEQNILLSYEEKADAMTAGSEAFTLDLLNNYRLYIGVRTERLNEERSKLEQLEASLQSAADTVRKTQREITQNNGRIDRCKDRIRVIERALEVAADNATDEESEELAATRLSRARATS